MKKFASLVLAGILTCAIAAPAAAADTTQILNGTPVVDAVLDDIYTQSASLTLEGPGFYTFGEAPDQTTVATSYMLWDSNYLYVCVVAEDETPLYAGVESGWKNDAAELWFIEEDLTYKIHAAGGGNLFLGTDADGKTAWNFDDVEFASELTEDGWIVEMALPMNDMAAGKEFAYTLQVNDIVTEDGANGYAMGQQITKDDAAPLNCVCSAEQVELPETEAVETAPEATAPQTFDAGVIAAVAAVVSAAGYALSKKR